MAITTPAPKLTLLVCLVLALGACRVLDSVDVAVFAWEGELSPTDPASPDGVSGSVAALSQGGRTRASIRISGANPDSEYLWRIRKGRCSNPGRVVGGLASYPRLEPSASGTAAADAVLSDSMPEGAYHGVVLEAVSESPVACAELSPP